MNYKTSTSGKDTGVHNTPALGEDLEKIVAILREKDTFEPKQSQGYDTFSFTEGILQRNTASKEQVLKKVEALVKINIIQTLRQKFTFSTYTTASTNITCT